MRRHRLISELTHRVIPTYASVDRAKRWVPLELPRLDTKKITRGQWMARRFFSEFLKSGLLPTRLGCG
jgi:hypothetical protein